MHDDAIFLLTSQLKECVCSFLDDARDRNADYPGCPCHASVVPGSSGLQVWDHCCDDCGGEPNGELIITVDRIYPSSTFPESDENLFNSTFDACKPPANIGVDLTLRIMRCYPTMDERGYPPSVEQKERVGRVAMIDMWTLFRATWCCLSQEIPTLHPRKKRKFVLKDHVAIGPAGGCVGSQLNVITTLDDNCLCPSPMNRE